MTTDIDFDEEVSAPGSDLLGARDDFLDEEEVAEPTSLSQFNRHASPAKNSKLATLTNILPAIYRRAIVTLNTVQANRAENRAKGKIGLIESQKEREDREAVALKDLNERNAKKLADRKTKIGNEITTLTTFLGTLEKDRAEWKDKVSKVEVNGVSHDLDEIEERYEKRQRGTKVEVENAKKRNKGSWELEPLLDDFRSIGGGLKSNYDTYSKVKSLIKNPMQGLNATDSVSGTNGGKKFWSDFKKLLDNGSHDKAEAMLKTQQDKADVMLARKDRSNWNPIKWLWSPVLSLGLNQYRHAELRQWKNTLEKAQERIEQHKNAYGQKEILQKQIDRQEDHLARQIIEKLQDKNLRFLLLNATPADLDKISSDIGVRNQLVQLQAYARQIEYKTWNKTFFKGYNIPENLKQVIKDIHKCAGKFDAEKFAAAIADLNASGGFIQEQGTRLAQARIERNLADTALATMKENTKNARVVANALQNTINAVHRDISDLEELLVNADSCLDINTVLDHAHTHEELATREHEYITNTAHGSSTSKIDTLKTSLTKAWTDVQHFDPTTEPSFELSREIERAGADKPAGFIRRALHLAPAA